MAFGAEKPAYNCNMTDSLFATPSLGLVRVALPVPIDSLFDYRVPESMDANAQPGHRVQVQFGGRPLVGLICQRLPESAREAPERVGQLASLDGVIDAAPVLSHEMIRMLGEAAAEILCPIGIALTTALPRGSEPRIVRRLALSARGRAALQSGAVSGDARAVLALLAEGPAAPGTVARKIPRAQTMLHVLERDGLLTRVQHERKPTARARTERTASLAPGIDLDAVCEGELARAPKQAELLRRIAHRPMVSVASLCAKRPQNANLLRTLEKRGFVQIGVQAAPRDVLGARVNRHVPVRGLDHDVVLELDGDELIVGSEAGVRIYGQDPPSGGAPTSIRITCPPARRIDIVVGKAAAGRAPFGFSIRAVDVPSSWDGA